MGNPKNIIHNEVSVPVLYHGGQIGEKVITLKKICKLDEKLLFHPTEGIYNYLI
jgi:hypothetical protein